MFSRTEGSSRLWKTRRRLDFPARNGGKADATARSADVKLFHRLAALALVVSLCFLAALAAAQNPPGARPVVPAAAGPRLALLDVSRIFKEHVRFKQQMDEMKAEVQAAENAVRAKREEITKLGEKLQMLQKGTDQYKQIDEDITAKQTELMLSINRSKAKFLQREAEIYYGVYQEIYQATDYICKQNSIDMVLRFSGEEADVQRPDSVLAWSFGSIPASTSLRWCCAT